MPATNIHISYEVMLTLSCRKCGTEWVPRVHGLDYDWECEEGKPGGVKAIQLSLSAPVACPACEALGTAITQILRDRERR